MQDNAEYVDSTHFYDGVTEYLDRTSQRSFRGYRRAFFFIFFKLRAKSWPLLRSMSILPMEARFHLKWRKQKTFQCVPLVSVFFTDPSFSELSPRMTYVLTVVKTNNLFAVLWKCSAYFRSLKWIAFVISFPFLPFPCVWYPSKKVWGSVIPNILLLESVWLPLCLSIEIRSEPHILIPFRSL